MHVDGHEHTLPFEPQTSQALTGNGSLVNGKGSMRWLTHASWTTILTMCTHVRHRFCSSTRLNELIELIRAVRVLAPEN